MNTIIMKIPLALIVFASSLSTSEAWLSPLPKTRLSHLYSAPMQHGTYEESGMMDDDEEMMYRSYPYGYNHGMEEEYYPRNSRARTYPIHDSTRLTPDAPRYEQEEEDDFEASYGTRDRSMNYHHRYNDESVPRFMEESFEMESPFSFYPDDTTGFVYHDDEMPRSLRP